MKYSISVGDQLKRINHTSVAVAVGIVFLATIVSSFTTGLTRLAETAHVQARILVDGATPLIRSGNEAAARDLLASMRRWPEVKAAQLVGPNERVLARYSRNALGAPAVAPATGQDLPGVSLDTWTVRQDFDDGSGRQARVVLTVGLGNLFRQTVWTGAVMLVAALAALGVSGLLLRRLEPAVLGPLHGLNRAMARVQERADLTVRARLSNVIEIDQLARGFNDMLEKIQDRDRQIERLAFSDGLTGLPNRSAFLNHLETEVQRSLRTGRRVGLLFLDLDGFKRVNDTLGHDIGDRLLVEAAARIREALRPFDVAMSASGAAKDFGAARLGGDEFTVLLAELQSVDDAMVVAHRIGGLLRQPFQIAGHALAISGSIGAAVFPDHGSDAAALMRSAAAAMYFAKRCGRDNSRMYDADVADRLKEVPPRDLTRLAEHA